MNVKTALEYIAIFVVFCVIFSLVGVVSVSAADIDVYINDSDIEVRSLTSDIGARSIALSNTRSTTQGLYYGVESYQVPFTYTMPGSSSQQFTSNNESYVAVYRTNQLYFIVYSLYPNTTVQFGSFTKSLSSRSGEFYYYNSYTSGGEYIYFPDGTTPFANGTIYSSSQDILSSLTTVPPVVPQSLEYSLPPGNAIYIQVPSGSSYTLNCRMPESVLGSNHYPGNNQAVTLVQSLPSGGSAPSSPLIPWAQTGALSYLGLSRNATYSASVASSGYLCIVNPLYYSGTANGPYEFLSNGAIDISVDSQTGFWVYPLDSTLGFTSGLGLDVSTEVLDSPYTGSIDPDTGEIIWEDSNGGSSAPSTGGGNLVDTSETIFDFLRNISQELSTFLKGPVSAIQTVVSSVRDFLSSFTQLYIWLPSPVYNLITSALMIALTIGVIKIFI